MTVASTSAHLQDEAPDREDSSSTPLGGERGEESRGGSSSGNEDGQNFAPISTELQDQLMVMGFPEEWCALALRENGNDIINASSWIVDNLDMLTRLSELQKRVGDGAEQEDEDDDGSGHSSAEDDYTQDAQHHGSNRNHDLPNHGSARSQAGQRHHPGGPLSMMSASYHAMSYIHSGEEQEEEEEKREEDSTGHGRHHSDVTDLGMMDDQVRSKAPCLALVHGGH